MMKDIDITKIRQLLLEAGRHIAVDGHICCPKKIDKCLKKALALLPCETCGGMELIQTEKSGHSIAPCIPCPDC